MGVVLSYCFKRSSKSLVQCVTPASLCGTLTHQVLPPHHLSCDASILQIFFGWDGWLPRVQFVTLPAEPGHKSDTFGPPPNYSRSFVQAAAQSSLQRFREGETVASLAANGRAKAILVLWAGLFQARACV